MVGDRLLDLVKPAIVRAQSLRSRISKGVTLGVRGLVTDDTGSVLLVRHSYVSGWYLPGGGVEPNETAVRSLERELLEEARIAIEGDPVLLGLYFNRGHAGRDHVALYRVDGFRIAGAFRPGAEIREIGFYPPDRLPEGTTDATRRRIDEHLAGGPASADW